MSHVPALIAGITKRRRQLGNAIVSKEEYKFIEPASEGDENAMVSDKTLRWVLNAAS